MENKEDKDFFHSLRKKELQDLCKRYGLSPYMTKSNLVNSLYSYLKKKNLYSTSHVESPSVWPTSTKPYLKCTESDNVNALKDSYKSTSVLEGENMGIHSSTDKCHEEESSVVAEVYNKVSVFNDLECPLNNVPETSRKSSTTIRSFEFHVSAEEGIKLIVDLNSSPSDWQKRLESEVCGCHNARNDKFGSLREGLEILGNSSNKMKKLFILSTDKEIETSNGHGGAGSSSISTQRECNLVVVDNPCGTDGSLRSSPIKPSKIVSELSALQLVKEEESLPVCRPDSNAGNLTSSGTESCQIDTGTVPVELSVINTQQIKSSHNSVVYSMQEPSESLNSMEHQNLKVGAKYFKDMEMNKTCTYLSPSRVYPGSSSSGSMELQQSEVLSQQKDALTSPCRYSCFPEVAHPNSIVEARDDEIAHSSTCAETQENMSTCVDEWEASKLLNEAETSGSSHLKKLLENRPEDLPVDGASKRKRENVLEEDFSCYSELNAQAITSRNHPFERVLPRRSKRLVSKV